MNVLVDTNILISSVLNPNSNPSKALLHAIQSDSVFLTAQNIQEFNRFVTVKKPSLKSAGDTFLEGLNFTWLPMVYSSKTVIRDQSDQPILNTAIAADIDIILTGDKDFLSLRLSRPKCFTPVQYLAYSYMRELDRIIRDLALATLKKLQTIRAASRTLKPTSNSPLNA